MVEGLGGEKQHQGHEDVQEIRLDDEVGIVEHQQGDDPEKEPGEPGVQAFLDLHDRDGGGGGQGGQGSAGGRGAPGARRRPRVAFLGLSAQSCRLYTAVRYTRPIGYGSFVGLSAQSWLPATIRQKCGFCQAEKRATGGLRPCAPGQGDRAGPSDEWHRPPAGEEPQAGSLCHYVGWARAHLSKLPLPLVPKLQLGNGIIRQTSGLPPLI